MKNCVVFSLMLLSLGVSAQSTSALNKPHYTGVQQETNSAQMPEELKGVTIAEKLVTASI
jgi:hypothetical protein